MEVPAIATSVEVVVAIASAMSPIIGGRAFTGNGRRLVPSGRRGVGVPTGWIHSNLYQSFLMFCDVSAIFLLLT